MRRIEIEEQKMILLEIVKEIDEYCSSQDIKYFLIGGSLIGAIRHKGFIPWDDDIDIGMDRESYERFISSYLSKTGNTAVISHKTDCNFYLPYAKVIDKRTTVIENVSAKKQLGIAVDVFPYDYCGNTYNSACEFSKNIRIWRNILALKNLKISTERGIAKNVIVLCSKLVLNFIPYQMINNNINNKAKAQIKGKTVYCGELTYMPYGYKEIYRSEWIEKTIRMAFENIELNVPIGYDDFLKTTFGNYLDLPPVEKRVTHHDYVAYWN